MTLKRENENEEKSKGSGELKESLSETGQLWGYYEDAKVIYYLFI